MNEGRRWGKKRNRGKATASKQGERASEEWKIDEKQMRDQKTKFLKEIKPKNMILHRL